MGQELDRLEKQGVIKKVEWAAPIVTVPKAEGLCGVTVEGLCGDYKVTVNQALTVDLPKLFATLANGHKFTKLDLRQAYLQMEPYVTINTHQGLYLLELPRHFSTAHGKHTPRYRYLKCCVLHWFSDGNKRGWSHEKPQRSARKIRLKCTFLAHSVEYLGHRIDKEGTSYCKCSSPDQCALIPRFDQLLRKIYPRFGNTQANKKWEWTARSPFRHKAEVLTHYNPELRRCIVLWSYFPCTSWWKWETNILCIPHTLSKWKKLLTAEAHIWGEHQYLYGRKFTLITDHKPLTGAIPTLAAARLRTSTVCLQLEIQYKSTDTHSNADGLSRLPLPTLGSDKGAYTFLTLQSLPRKCHVTARTWDKPTPVLAKYWDTRGRVKFQVTSTTEKMKFQSNPTGEFE